MVNLLCLLYFLLLCDFKCLLTSFFWQLKHFRVHLFIDNFIVTYKHCNSSRFCCFNGRFFLWLKLPSYNYELLPDVNLFFIHQCLNIRENWYKHLALRISGMFVWTSDVSNPKVNRHKPIVPSTNHIWPLAKSQISMRRRLVPILPAVYGVRRAFVRDFIGKSVSRCKKCSWKKNTYCLPVTAKQSLN